MRIRYIKNTENSASIISIDDFFNFLEKELVIKENDGKES